MVRKKGIGLILSFTDIPAEKEEEYDRWFKEEHYSQMLAVPGFLGGARYVAVKGAPKYLDCYELENPEVMESREYKSIPENPTEWSKRMAPRFIGANFMPNVYRQIFPVDVSETAAQGDMAPFLQIGRMSVPSEIEDEFNEWYNAVHIPNFEAVPGCISGRRYRAVRGDPKYATVYELEHENVSRTPAWETARTANPWSERIRPHMTHAPGSAGIYRRIHPP